MENLPVGIANSYCHFSGDNIMLFFLHYQYGTNLSLNKRTLRRLFFLFLSVIRFSLFVFYVFYTQKKTRQTQIGTVKNEKKMWKQRETYTKADKQTSKGRDEPNA